MILIFNDKNDLQDAIEKGGQKLNIIPPKNLKRFSKLCIDYYIFKWSQSDNDIKTNAKKFKKEREMLKIICESTIYNDLESRCGVTRAKINHYFKNKGVSPQSVKRLRSKIMSKNPRPF